MLKNNPLVTVYITNYNYGKFIKKAINSFLNQTFKNYELIIIDDGSKDKSVEIIKEFQYGEEYGSIEESDVDNKEKDGEVCWQV